MHLLLWRIIQRVSASLLLTNPQQLLLGVGLSVVTLRDPARYNWLVARDCLRERIVGGRRQEGFGLSFPGEEESLMKTRLSRRMIVNDQIGEELSAFWNGGGAA